MGYSSQSDIENVFGTDNVRKWSNLDNNVTGANTTRIATAIALADRQIDNMLRRSKYAVPLQGTHGALVEVTNWSATLAGVWLYEARGLEDTNEITGQLVSKFSGHRRRVENEIKAVLSGKIELAANRQESRSPTAPVVCRG